MSYFESDSDIDDEINSIGGASSDDDEPLNPPDNEIPKKSSINELLDENENGNESNDEDDGDGDETDVGMSESDIDSDFQNEEDDEEEELKQETNKKSKSKKENTNDKKIKSSIKKLLNFNEEEEEDDENYDNEDYLQKFNEDITKNYILDNHPECIVHNYNEVLSMCQTIKDTSGIIIDDFHKTIPYLTKYERARILGVRAKQINSGATPFIKLEEGLIDGYIIAEMELKEKKIPFIVRRPMPNGGSEYWFLKDLEDLSY